LPDPDDTLLQDVRALFESGAISKQEAATRLGMSAPTLTSRIRTRWHWKIPPRLRTNRKGIAKPIKRRSSDASLHEELSTQDVQQRLHMQISVLMRAIEANVGEDGLPIDAERHAKLVAAAFRLQAEAARQDEQKERGKDGQATADKDEQAAATELARLRDDLAAKLAGHTPPDAADGSAE
jgi:hypothetical protein